MPVDHELSAHAGYHAGAIDICPQKCDRPRRHLLRGPHPIFVCAECAALDEAERPAAMHAAPQGAPGETPAPVCPRTCQPRRVA